MSCLPKSPPPDPDAYRSRPPAAVPSPPPPPPHSSRPVPSRPVPPCTGGAQKLRVPNRKRAGLSENSYVTDNPTRAKYRICPGTVITIRLFVGSTDFATTPECAEFFFIFRKEYYVRWRISNDILGRGCPPIYLYNHIFRNFLSLTI